MFGFKSKLMLALEVARLNGELTAVRTELARANAHFDWLASHVNELKLERAQIMDRVFGIQLPVAEILRQPAAPATPLAGADPNYTPTSSAADVAPLPPLRQQGKGDLLAIAREIRDRHARGQDSTDLVGQAVGAVSFEDMGEDEAKRQGIEHDANGELTYLKG